MQDCLFSHNKGGIEIWVSGDVVIAVVVGKVAAGDIQTDPMTGQKDIRSRIHTDRVMDCLSGLNETRVVDAITKPRSDHAERNVAGQSVGFDVDQPHDEVGVWS